MPRSRVALSFALPVAALVVVSMRLPLVAGDESEPSFRPAPFGIRERVPLTTSKVVGSPEPPPPFKSERAFPKIDIVHPLYVIELPGTHDLLVVPQTGKIIRFENRDDVESSQVFLDMKRESYGLTFHPKFAENGWMYVVSNGEVVEPAIAESPGVEAVPEKSLKKNRVSRFTVSREPPYACDPASEFIILEWPSNGHNGGDLAFGPDGCLYIPAGDGTSDSDTDDTGQGVNDLNAVLMRIDVDHPDPGKTYSVPKDNPFVNVEGARPEIWAFGFRNPWRCTFDAKTGHLWVGNIGQDQWEMIHLVRKGDNYGWSAYEGSHPFQLLRKIGPAPVVKPTIEHPHSEARSITGGLVYYGAMYPELTGYYFYGDYSTGKVWIAKHDGEKLLDHKEIADTPVQILGFAIDHRGGILMTDYAGGIHRLVRAPKVENPPKFPTKLSETGLYESVAGHKVQPALIPYSVNASLWSDGAHKERFLAIPGDGQIDYASRNGWNCPEQTVLVKTFSLDLEAGNPQSRRRIETRLMTKQLGEWVGYSYLWNDEQTEAELVSAAGLDKTYTIKDAAAPGGTRTQTWRYPSRAECMVCHSRAANYVLGLSELQFNRDHDYGGVVANQLRTLEHLGIFRTPGTEHELRLSERVALLDRSLRDGLLLPWNVTEDHPSKKVKAAVKLGKTFATNFLPAELIESRRIAVRLWRGLNPMVVFAAPTIRQLPKRPDEYSRLVDPYDASAGLELRVRSYLHANCAVCHVEAGGGNSRMQLDFITPRDRMAILDAKPQHQSFHLADPRVIAPGDPDRSVMLQRLSRRGPGQMPPLASTIVDEKAVALMREWIKSLESTRSAATP